MVGAVQAAAPAVVLRSETVGVPDPTANVDPPDVTAENAIFTVSASLVPTCLPVTITSALQVASADERFTNVLSITCVGPAATVVALALLETT